MWVGCLTLVIWVKPCFHLARNPQILSWLISRILFVLAVRCFPIPKFSCLQSGVWSTGMDFSRFLSSPKFSTLKKIQFLSFYPRTSRKCSCWGLRRSDKRERPPSAISYPLPFTNTRAEGSKRVLGVFIRREMIMNLWTPAFGNFCWLWSGYCATCFRSSDCHARHHHYVICRCYNNKAHPGLLTFVLLKWVEYG